MAYCRKRLGCSFNVAFKLIGGIIMDILKEQTPIAKKEHVCNWCGGKIAKGEKYYRQTVIFDGSIYDWISHLDCYGLVDLLNMYDYDDGNGIDEECFRQCIDEYIDTHHYDKEVDDIDKEWDNIPMHEKVKKIVEELKGEQP